MPITSKDGFKGNSDTATKLATPRSINGTNFDGTANISTANWGTARTLTIGNTGKSVNGSGNVSWSLSEIGAAPTGYGLGSVCSNKSSQDCNNILTTGFYMGSNMTNKPSGCTQGWIYLLVMRHNDSWVRQVAYDFGTASQIYTRVKQNNTWSSWVATDNNTWRGVQDNLTSSATDQSLSANQGKVLKGLVDGKAASNHTHTSLKVADTRNANTAPSALDSVFSVDFKNRSTINNAPGAGTYNGLLQFAPWNDSSGGNGYQMSYGYSGTVPYLGIRTADLNSSSWGSWYEIYHTGRKPSKADVGLSNVQNWTATSDTNDSSRSKYATAAGVKAAYDKANSAYTMASNSPSLYTYECDFSSNTIYNITLPSGFTRSNVIIVGAMMMNSTNTEVDRPLIVGMDIAMAPLPPGTQDDKFSFYYTGGTINQKVRVVIMKVGNLYR